MSGGCGVEAFQAFVSSDEQLQAFGSCVRPTNLLRLSRDGGRELGSSSGGSSSRVALVVDAENGLDRLYGGYFSDWCCGGQWAHALDFLANLVSTLHSADVQLAFFLDGSLSPDRFPQWRAQQLALRDQHVAKALRHVHKRATPPPKAWWVPPTAVRTVLKLALKTLGYSVFNSVEDHKQEVIGFCWENGYHGIMADDAEYALINPPRYFSLRSLKMTFQFEISSVEFVMDEVAKSLDLNPNRFGLLGALLGNHILTPEDLQGFHQKLAPELKKNNCKVGYERVIRAVVTYVRALPKTDDFEQIGKDVFGSSNDPRIKKLRSSLSYFQSCTQEGYKPKPRHYPSKKKKLSPIKFPVVDGEQQIHSSSPDSPRDQKNQMSSKDKRSDAEIVERIALDLDHLVLDAIKAIENEGAAVGPAGDDAVSHGAKKKHTAREDMEEVLDVEPPDEEDEEKGGEKVEDEVAEPMSVIQALASGQEVQASEEGKYPSKKAEAAASASAIPPVKPISIPDVHPDVYRTAFERHRQAQMSPLVYQVLTRGEIKLPVLLEDHKSFAGKPPLHLFYQPIRKSIYAILFNLHHQKFNRKQAEEAVKANRRKAEELKKQAKKCKSESEKTELCDRADALSEAAVNAKIVDKVEVSVREWMPYNNYEYPESVEAEELNWAVPTVQRLWFGSSLEDKQKRLRAFLSCLRCDNCPPLLSPTSVPQQMILLACILRYIMTNPSNLFLTKPELDAILATAFSPELRDPRFLTEMKLDLVTKRGVEIGTMIMQGVEMALFANDACGAPIPFQMCLPWNFFDGKLFHSKLLRAESSRNLMELCDGRMEMVYAVERMRCAIMHGLVPQYANPFGVQPVAPFAAEAYVAGASSGRAGGPRIDSRGGTLVVGGAVVGQWAGSAEGQHKKKKNQKKTSAAKAKKNGGGKKKAAAASEATAEKTESSSKAVPEDKAEESDGKDENSKA